MHRLWRYDVFRFAQNDVAPVGRNDAMFAPKCGEATHHQAKPSSLAKPTSFAAGKHHSKNAPLSIDKSAIFVAIKNGGKNAKKVRYTVHNNKSK